MNQRVLVVNCGSSTVKYQVVQPGTGQRHASGLIEGIGGPAVADHDAALRSIFDRVDLTAVVAVGHRVVHGGDRFTAPTLVDDGVLAGIEALAALAPLHNPVNLAGIRAAAHALPGVPQVAVFDTAFHATLPPRARTYAVPAAWRSEFGVRRYGFHGTSYAYVARRTARLLGADLGRLNAILLHLGNGASACAVADGRSVDTSMGMTPLAGLVMGSRSGDLDPAVPGHLARVAGLDSAEVDRQLNGASGLRALAGTNDVREITRLAAAGDADAELALEVYCYRIRCYIGAYTAVLGRVDAIVFTGGVGENSALVRARSLDGLDSMGIVLDDVGNAAPSVQERVVHAPISRVAIAVVPTDEEREIAAQALAVVADKHGPEVAGSRRAHH